MGLSNGGLYRFWEGLLAAKFVQLFIDTSQLCTNLEYIFMDFVALASCILECSVSVEVARFRLIEGVIESLKEELYGLRWCLGGSVESARINVVCWLSAFPEEMWNE